MGQYCYCEGAFLHISLLAFVWRRTTREETDIVLEVAGWSSGNLADPVFGSPNSHDQRSKSKAPTAFTINGVAMVATPEKLRAELAYLMTMTPVNAREYMIVYDDVYLQCIGNHTLYLGPPTLCGMSTRLLLRVLRNRHESRGMNIPATALVTKQADRRCMMVCLHNHCHLVEKIPLIREHTVYFF